MRVSGLLLKNAGLIIKPGKVAKKTDFARGLFTCIMYSSMSFLVFPDEKSFGIGLGFSGSFMLLPG